MRVESRRGLHSGRIKLALKYKTRVKVTVIDRQYRFLFYGNYYGCKKFYSLTLCVCHRKTVSTVSQLVKTAIQTSELGLFYKTLRNRNLR
jgi:hypothetical protein